MLCCVPPKVKSENMFCTEKRFKLAARLGGGVCGRVYCAISGNGSYTTVYVTLTVLISTDSTTTCLFHQSFYRRQVVLSLVPFCLAVFRY